MNRLAAITESALRRYARLAPSEKGSFRLVRQARRLRPTDQWKDRFHTPGGLWLDLDLGTYPDCCMAFGLYELTTARRLRRLVKPGDRVIDAGANLGYFTLLAALRAGPLGHVHAFEPEPHNRQRLIDHLRLNELEDRVTVHDVALADKNAQAEIHYFGNAGGHNHGESSLYPGDAQPRASTSVALRSLDSVLTESRETDAPTPSLVKLDIEGAEPPAIEGMAGLLSADRPPCLIGEINPTQAAAAGYHPGDWVRRALELQPRYRLYRVGMRLRRVEDSRSTPDRLGQQNLLLTVDPL